jgi:3-phosphoshikimate 1-carboxyvinyltransferase
MSDQVIQPARGLVGSALPPGDKSISHRLAILGALAEGSTELANYSRGEDWANYSRGEDCRRTLDCLQALGINVEVAESQQTGKTVRIEGNGLGGLRAPAQDLYAGNSGSTLRMLAGVLAAQPFESVLGGDDSLNRRPMRRIMEPLRQMGASLKGQEGDLPPLRIRGGQPIDYVLPVASAQVKTAVLLAGLHAAGDTSVQEPARTRDHTEVALKQFGARVKRERSRVTVKGQPELHGKSFAIPNDLSAAAFLIAGAFQVGLNPTRTALLDFLVQQGADIKVLEVEDVDGELRGNLHVRGGVTLTGGNVEGALTAHLIDEIPVLAVMGSQGEKGFRLRDASELRAKESDRLVALAQNLRRMGARVEELPDGLDVPGGQELHGAEVESYGDHRIAMAFAVAGLVAEGETNIQNTNCADVSFPGFFEILAGVRQ